jgi:diadenosine tetraphosphate (Ap4A) HIT family hydrolase
VGLVAGHVAIIPVKHTESARQSDEEVWAEIAKFKASLRKMFSANNKAILFMESAIELGKKRHAAIEGVPVPR